MNDVKKAVCTLAACALFAVYGEISHAVGEADKAEHLSSQITLHIPAK